MRLGMSLCQPFFFHQTAPVHETLLHQGRQPSGGFLPVGLGGLGRREQGFDAGRLFQVPIDHAEMLA
ncbi:hypothetical protein AC628_18625 [Bradyrhizobium sp. NAS96.2]|nr:hypothetical protein AC628_18625 [Bradyrhizobium sp. NAS96.2]